MHARGEKYLGHMAGPAERGRFANAMKTAAAKGAIITTHDVPDCDGLGSAFALQRVLLKKGAQADIVTGPPIHLTDPLVEKLSIHTKRWDEIPELDSRPIIVVDTNTPSLLNGMGRRKNQLLMVIDHHLGSGACLKPVFNVENQKAISASEILASVINRKEIDMISALALAVGIAGDSERLSDAELGTLRIFESLLRISGASKREVDALAYPDNPPAIVAAILEELKRVKSALYRNTVIAVGASALENPAILANEIRNMGAAVVAVLGAQGNGYHKVSFRVRFMDAWKGGIHANDIARRASEACGMPERMWGGGHIDKAGAMIRGECQEITDAVFAAAKEAIDRAAGKQ
ncbi:DHH family phosphoesterase [Candidatus Micrarchaeota archaeon]|nr:DHH family phosphoesterase [Candidatus Micrarchaeota archaeon]